MKNQHPLTREFANLCQEANLFPDDTWDYCVETEVTSNETNDEFFEVVYFTYIIESPTDLDGVSYEECFYVRHITEGYHKPTKKADLHKFNLVPVDQRPTPPEVVAELTLLECM